MSTFAERLIAWQQVHGRHDLPWQGTTDPYRIWLSEIMLQQTQVATVIPYYQRFLARFPDVATLAAASEEAVMSAWSGLGYYSRARHLHRAAQAIMAAGGEFPRTPDALAALPGIGRSTAAAICAFAFGRRAAILDGNVKRLLARHAGIDGYPGEARVQARLWAEAEARLPERGIEAYTQGLMDLGNSLCARKNPQCDRCPVSVDCEAQQTGRQNELPTPKPGKRLPEKACRMLVLRADNRVLLLARRQPGVWQGLWSLPETAADAEPLAAAAALGFTCPQARPLPAFTHVFSHYRLHIEPVYLEVQAVSAVAALESRWQALDALDEAPLPTPVRRLLKALPPVV